MKRLLKTKATWTPIWMIAFLMLCMISIYLPVFGGPSQRLTNFPLIIVDEDTGTSSLVTAKEIGNHLIQAQNGHTFNWRIVPNKEAAVKELKDNQAYGALIIPANYSDGITELHNALMTGKTEGKPIMLEILINEGGGLSTTAIATNVLESVATVASTDISKHLKEDLLKNNILLSPNIAFLMDAPIQYTTTNVLDLPENSNKGMTPFMLVLITSISGLMGVNMINGYIKNITGKLRDKDYLLTDTKILVTELLLGVILAAIVAFILQLAIFGFFRSSHSTSIWWIFLFTFLCCMTLHFQFKIVGLLFGKWGMLVMFPLNIMGVFSSGGAVPITSLPFIHRFFSTVLPTRYMVDGMRALLYYNGKLQAGLGTALLVITIFFIIFLGSCIAVGYRIHRKEQANT
ncbi:YhgE/Pip domain-containing protein [Psychrobacillus sp. OK032]|uniref:YhgE/Pip domain-containing protein n=1 Tax=Psychrobacillus sp. OK032 TaxID=1884358 RepID=UPI0008C270CB|nr:ABC transporter permease [Psychrobacillus sp. OK032]SES31076.1 YhgE/Pip N-terminal domain-containing protein [Psychrobacillus sp. OK032]